MEVTKAIKATYPTVTYGSVEIFTAVKISDADLPASQQALPLQEKAQQLDQWATHLAQQGFIHEYEQVSNNLAGKYLGGILPPQVEQHLMQTGRLKR